jgi:hypothetical protein
MTGPDHSMQFHLKKQFAPPEAQQGGQHLGAKAHAGFLYPY